MTEGLPPLLPAGELRRSRAAGRLPPNRRHPGPPHLDARSKTDQSVAPICHAPWLPLNDRSSLAGARNTAFLPSGDPNLDGPWAEADCNAAHPFLAWCSFSDGPLGHGVVECVTRF